MWQNYKYSIWMIYLLELWIHVCDVELPLLFLSLSPFLRSFGGFFLQTTANLVLFILDLIGYNNLINHSKNVDILYKVLRLLEGREQIITDRNIKTNYQMTKSANHPLTVMWIAMHLHVNATAFRKNCRLQRVCEIVSDATEWQKSQSGFTKSVDL